MTETKIQNLAIYRKERDITEYVLLVYREGQEEISIAVDDGDGCLLTKIIFPEKVGKMLQKERENDDG